MGQREYPDDSFILYKHKSECLHIIGPSAVDVISPLASALGLLRAQGPEAKSNAIGSHVGIEVQILGFH